MRAQIAEPGRVHFDNLLNYLTSHQTDNSKYSNICNLKNSHKSISPGDKK